MLEAISAALGFGLPQPAIAREIRPFYFVARPGFSGGFGSYLDLFSPLTWNYTTYYGPAVADDVAVYADWYMVGQDLLQAAERSKSLDA